VSFYPPKINERFLRPQYAGDLKAANAVGTGASFLCGSALRFKLAIEREGKIIKNARFRASGCGYLIAAADALAENIVGKRLTDLHGLDQGEIGQMIAEELGEFSFERMQCLDICREALVGALADFRASQLEEFAGEKALICTCFGVSEDAIEKIIAENKAQTVEDVGDLCHAGTGCGSCRMLIGELIEVYQAGQEVI
jgi:NifU-like protein